MTNLIDFKTAKLKFDNNIIMVGDTIEWKDFTGELYEAEVKGIYTQGLGVMNSNRFLAPKKIELTQVYLDSCEEVVFELENSMTLSGICVVRKLTKKPTVADRIKANNNKVLEGMKHESSTEKNS